MRREFDRILRWLEATEEPGVEESVLDKGIYIYGAGELGHLALDYCEACGIPVLGYLDRSRTQTIKSRLGRDYLVVPPSSALAHQLQEHVVAVAIATQPYWPIHHQLQELGWKSVVPFYQLTAKPREGHPLRNGWYLGTVSDQERKMVEEICALWEDEDSWTHYEAFLAWHCDGTEIDLQHTPIFPTQRYALPELLNVLGSQASQFVDVGGHKAESVRRMRDSGVIFDEYVIFEPDPSSRAALHADLPELIPRGAKTIVHPQVLSDSKKSVRYQSNLGYCSQIWEKGFAHQEAATLDSFGLQPSFLKVHTEGSEALILKGGENTIRESRPVIAYSVYHRREGFYKDIHDVMSSAQGYKWYFRLHSFQGTGGFVYGVPINIS